MNEKKLKARDFITIGIFTAILWVVQMVIMYLGFLSPFIVAGYTVLIPIVTGIPMMLYYARIEKFGMAYNNIGYCCNPVVYLWYGLSWRTYLYCSRSDCRFDCQVREI